MRVLFVTMEYPPDTGLGGIGSNISGMVPPLVERGHEVHVLSCYPGQAERDVDHAGATVHRRRRRSLPLLHRLLPGPHLAPRIEGALSVYLEYRRLGLRPDVVNMPDWFGEGLLLGWLTRRPLVAYLHTPVHLIARHNGTPLGRAGRLADRLERAAVGRASVVTSTSRAIADDLAGWLPPHTPVRITPPPVDVVRFAGAAPVGATAPLVVAVGRIEARKAPELLVDAAARLRDEGVPVEVALLGRSSGTRDGLEYADWVAARAEAAGVPLDLPGHVGRDDVAAWFGRARAVAVPSAYESFSIAALEGAAAGRPVAVTDQVGAREVLAGPGGAVVPVGDAGALAAALRPWVVDPEVAAAEGAAVRERVVAECAPARAAERREAAFVEAVRRGPAPLLRVPRIRVQRTLRAARTRRRGG